MDHPGPHYAHGANLANQPPVTWARETTRDAGTDDRPLTRHERDLAIELLPIVRQHLEWPFEDVDRRSQEFADTALAVAGETAKRLAADCRASAQLSPAELRLVESRHELDAAALDPGIRALVLELRAHGFDTTDSGDGVSKPAEQRAMDVPHVAIGVTEASLASEARRLAALLSPAWRIQATFDPRDGSAVLMAFMDPETEPATAMGE